MVQYNNAISWDMIKYNFYLDLCEVSYVKGNESYEWDRSEGSSGTWMIKYVCVYAMHDGQDLKHPLECK